MIIQKIKNTFQDYRKINPLLQYASLFYFLTRLVFLSKLAHQKIKFLSFFCKKDFVTTSFQCLLITIFLTVCFGNYAHSDDQANLGKNHFRQCNPEGGTAASSLIPKPTQLDFNPTGGGEDFVYEIDNPICAAIVLGPYAAVKVSIAAMNGVCGTGSSIPRIFPSIFLDVIDLAKAGSAATSNAACAAAVSAAATSLTTMVAAVGFQYLAAKDVYNNTGICGGNFNENQENWMQWNNKTMLKDIPFTKKFTEELVKNKIEECNSDSNSDACELMQEAMANKDYRQWYYSGVEREDNSDDPCTDPSIEAADSEDNIRTVPKLEDEKIKWYVPQKYYMRGTDPANYACNRFSPKLNSTDPLTNGPLSSARIIEYQDAYQCCIKKSKSTICIEKTYCKTGGYTNLCPEKNNIVTEHKFCYGGTQCSIGNIEKTTFVAKFEDNNRMICASTYNYCPYNFNIGGGSTFCDFYIDGTKDEEGIITIIDPEKTNGNSCGSDSEIRKSNCKFNDKAGKCRNYCQYLNHCVIIADNDYIYETEITSPYFSTACLDFVGDSKNSHSYGKAIAGKTNAAITGVQKHFTAPIAQCFKETLENVFFNKAGHSKCGNANEVPDKYGKCFSDFYQYKQNQNVADRSSFFSYLQEKLKDLIRLALTISVMLLGVKILLTGAPLKQPELIMYVVKIGLVLFFATSSAWQDFFFDGVYSVSSSFSTIVMNVKTTYDKEKRDGCQFGSITIENGSKIALASDPYPRGKEYLSVFDTLDCKIARYLGFGPSFSVANIAKIILASFFTGPIGIYFAVLVSIFGIYMVVVAFRALHIFISSAFAIILLVYVSPITITATLFKRTEKIFTGWLIQLISYTLQPIILFAYVGFFITIFDSLVNGSATFVGEEGSPEKTIVCDRICADYNGNTKFVISKNDGLDMSNNGEECDLAHGDQIIDASSDSVACIMNLKNDTFGKIPVLEPLGIALPLLIDFFTDNGRQKLLTLLKAVLVIFILESFMAEIPAIASDLTGGSKIPGSNISVEGLTKKAIGVGLAMQKRGKGASIKIGSSLVNSAGNAKGAAREIGNRGKRASSGSKGDSGGSGSTSNDSG